MATRFSAWLFARRTATRLAFFLQIGCRVLTSLFSLVWIPLLLKTMGKELNGLFLNFQSIASMGGLGDLGMGGMVNIQTSRLLGQGREPELRGFLAAARGFFGVMAVAAGGIFLALSPSLLHWQKFENFPQASPLAGLYLIGAVATGLVILNSYITNLNYGCGNIVWPVLPGFILLQMAFLAHWLFARQGLPLWVQYTPYVSAAMLTHALNWWWIRLSHPFLGTLRPVTVDWRQFLLLAGKSFWVYLYALSGSIYITISTLLITARFGPETLVIFRYNAKLCELAYFVVNSACVASLPKITQWLASPEAAIRGRALREAERLNKFQTLLGCSAALVYLAVNDWFIGLWLGRSLHAPLPWQAAFAANLAVTSGGLAGFELAARCCDGGIRVGGITVSAMALLNLGLSLVAMKLGSILGIALATVVTQSMLTLGLGWYACRHMKTSWWRLSLRNWFLAMGAAGLGIVLRIYLPVSSALTAAVAAAVCLAAMLLVAFLLGIRISDLREELAILRGMVGKR